MLKTKPKKRLPQDPPRPIPQPVELWPHPDLNPQPLNSLKLQLSLQAYWHLQWLCKRTQCEVSSMGLLQPTADGFRIEDFILVRQAVSGASVDLDMEWWADRQVALFEERGIQPWQTSCWCHTHPAGINGPSDVDEQTMTQAFGKQDLALMLILTKAGCWYARADYNHDFCGLRTRLSLPCAIDVDWNDPIQDGRQLLTTWEQEFKDLVTERTYDYGPWLMEDREPTRQAGSYQPIESMEQWTPKEEEEPWSEDRDTLEEYVDLALQHGLDPRQDKVYEDYFGGGAVPTAIMRTRIARLVKELV